MKKRFVLAMSSVMATLVAVAMVVFFHAPVGVSDGNLVVSFAGGAALAEPSVAANDAYDLSSHQTLSRVVLLVRENYVEPERIHPYEMFLAALDQIQKTVPEVMVDDSRAPERIKVRVGAVEQVFELGTIDQLWEVTMALRDVFRFLEARIPRAEQRRDIEYAAVNGMLSTLDPHSVLLGPEGFDEMKQSTKGEFGGLGIVIMNKEGALSVVSTMEGTPAARAGIKAQDRITKIGEESTVNMKIEEAVQRLRGRPGTKVNISVQRRGWPEPRRIALVRATIKTESVASKLLSAGIAYVKIKGFQNNTYDDLHDHLERLRKENKAELRGLVLDLRNNPGGLLDQAVLVSDRFIERGPIVITVGEGNRKREVKEAHFAGTEADYPLAVLVNGGSASASEIVAGALQNQNRAVVIGQQTFGKGSVQILYEFKEKSALKLTVAQYLTPGGRSIQGVGITPDINVVPVSARKDAVRVFADSDSPREKDLEKHLDRLRDNGAPETVVKPAVRIAHVVDDVDGAGKDAAEDPTTSSDLGQDFETRLAHDILLQTKERARAGIIQSAMQPCAGRARDEERRIEERLQQLGVDWTVPSVEDVAKADTSVQVDLAVGRSDSRTVRAGDAVRLTASVHNRGARPLYRLYGVTSSDNPLFHHLEFPFGRIEPGSTRSWSVEVKLAEDSMPRADSITITVADALDKLAPVTTSTLVTIDEQPKPRLAFIATLDDYASGNGDGVLQPGERAQLDVRLSNLGPGVAKDTVVSVKNLAGDQLVLERGRQKLGLLESGASKTATLTFVARHDIKVDSVDLRLAMWDNVLSSAVSEIVKLPVLGSRRVESVSQVLKAGGTADVPVYAAAMVDAPVIGFWRMGSLFRSDAHVANEWRRTELQPGWQGFVRDADVRLSKTPWRGAQRQAPRLIPARSAPTVLVDLPILTASDDNLRLRGVVGNQRALRDLFVFVNERKVYYRSLTDLTPSASDHSVKTTLDMTVPLKKGSNTITVVARENDELVTRRTFGVFRGQEASVADAKRVEQPIKARDP